MIGSLKGPRSLSHFEFMAEPWSELFCQARMEELLRAPSAECKEAWVSYLGHPGEPSSITWMLVRRAQRTEPQHLIRCTLQPPLYQVTKIVATQGTPHKFQLSPSVWLSQTQSWSDDEEQQ